MQNSRHLGRFQRDRFTTWEFPPPSQPDVRESRYRHILVSTRLCRTERAALRLGFELAALHHSKLTLLHVLPRRHDERPAEGLDAIGRLHAAADQVQETLAAGASREPASRRLCEFVGDIVPLGLLAAVCWRGECRNGDVTGAIVSYVNESAADLVILPAEPCRWWLPIRGLPLRAIERRTQANVIVIRGQAPSLLS